MPERAKPALPACSTKTTQRLRAASRLAWQGCEQAALSGPHCLGTDVPNAPQDGENSKQSYRPITFFMSILPHYARMRTTADRSPSGQCLAESAAYAKRSIRGVRELTKMPDKPLRLDRAPRSDPPIRSPSACETDPRRDGARRGRGDSRGAGGFTGREPHEA
jgi:hypothetical protein